MRLRAAKVKSDQLIVSRLADWDWSDPNTCPELRAALTPVITANRDAIERYTGSINLRLADEWGVEHVLHVAATIAAQAYALNFINGIEYVARELDRRTVQPIRKALDVAGRNLDQSTRERLERCIVLNEDCI